LEGYFYASFSGLLPGYLDHGVADVEAGDFVLTSFSQLDAEIAGAWRYFEDGGILRELIRDSLREFDVLVHHFGGIGCIPGRHQAFYSAIGMRLAHCQGCHGFLLMDEWLFGLRRSGNESGAGGLRALKTRSG